MMLASPSPSLTSGRKAARALDRIEAIRGGLSFAHPHMISTHDPWQDTGWTPSQLPSLVLWLRSDLGVTQSSGVTGWADQSGAGNNATGSGGTKPSFQTGILNGWPAIRCDGVSQQLSIASASNLNFGQGSFDVFAVVVPRKVAAFQVILGKSSNADAANLRFFINSGNSPQIFWGGGASAYPAGAQTTASGTAAMIEWGLNAGATTERTAVGTANGTTSGLTLSGTGSNSLPLIIGTDNANGFPSQYDYLEIIVCGAFLSGAQRGQLASYFKSRYGTSVAG